MLKYILSFALLLISPVFSQERLPKYFELLQEELNAAYFEAATGFINATSAEEALEYISSPNHAEFKAAYDGLKTEFELDKQLHLFSHNMNQYAMARNNASKGKKGLLFLVWHRDMDVPKVDWKATYAYGTMSWAKFMTEMPEIPIEMRVTVGFDNYYNYQFSDDAVWQCFAFYTEASEERMYAYMRRDNPKFKHLFSETRKKKTTSITVKVAYPEGEKKKGQVEIVEMLADTWFDNVK